MDYPSEQPRWSLKDLVDAPDGSQMSGYLAQLEENVAALEAARARLVPEITEQDFLDVVRIYEAIYKVSSRLNAYVDLWFTEDTQNQAALNLIRRIEQVQTDAANRTLFFSLWFKDLPDEAATRLIASSDRYGYFLDTIRRFKPHILSEAEEKIITLKDANGMDALLKVYEMITNRFTFTLEVDGEVKSLTRDQLTAYYRHPSPDVRESTYRELYRVYGENATLLSEIYSHRALDWHAEQLDLRGFSEPLSARNLSNDLADRVVDTLLAVCRQNNGLFQRYFTLKARLLGINKLRRYDIYAPLAPSERKYEYSQAVDIVLSTFRGFSPHMEEYAQRVFREDHLDAQVRPGKRGGAFCMSVLPELTPWVMVNYAGRARDMATLAHELGHAVHGMLASSQSALTFHASMPLAETASVFAEMLLTERLLKEESDTSVRRDLLMYAIDDAYATVQRQAYITLFERDAHRMLAENVSMEELTEHYIANLIEQFGDAVELSDEFRWEWVSIPHIYNSPFYTYSYSFGQLLVLALYQQYKVQGQSFLPRYFKILSYGGSASPEKILNEVGLDITSPDFWQGGYDVIQSMVEELEEVV